MHAPCIRYPFIVKTLAPNGIHLYLACTFLGRNCPPSCLECGKPTVLGKIPHGVTECWRAHTHTHTHTHVYTCQFYKRYTQLKPQHLKTSRESAEKALGGHLSGMNSGWEEGMPVGVSLVFNSTQPGCCLHGPALVSSVYQ